MGDVSQGSRQKPSRAAEFSTDEKFAIALDREDRLATFRGRFHIPTRSDGRDAAYLCGNSLGLQPCAASGIVEQELDDWAHLAVDAHFEGATPWYTYQEVFREPTARLVGAEPEEVVVMNALTVNLHLMLISFYRPTAGRFKILMEENAFPSDTYAVKSQIRNHGLDPDAALLIARGRPGEAILRTEDVEELIEQEGDRIALVMMGGVNYFSGQLFEMRRITECARRRGAVVGFDLAHAAGNVPLEMSDWNVDFAVWCSYKYLNAGPGAVAGCFVHRRHLGDRDLPRLAGWWGNDPQTRFRMHLEPEFVPVARADGWQLSNPPILALAPLQASLALFDEAGAPALRAKSQRLTAYLEAWIDEVDDARVRVLTPRDPDARGCQLSLQLRDGAPEMFRVLVDHGVIGDYREPDTVRVAPVPLYNTFHDVWRFGQGLRRWSSGD